MLILRNIILFSNIFFVSLGYGKAEDKPEKSFKTDVCQYVKSITEQRKGFSWVDDDWVSVPDSSLSNPSRDSNLILYQDFDIDGDGGKEFLYKVFYHLGGEPIDQEVYILKVRPVSRFGVEDLYSSAVFRVGDEAFLVAKEKMKKYFPHNRSNKKGAEYIKVSDQVKMLYGSVSAPTRIDVFKYSNKTYFLLRSKYLDEQSIYLSIAEISGLYSKNSNVNLFCETKLEGVKNGVQ